MKIIFLDVDGVLVHTETIAQAPDGDRFTIPLTTGDATPPLYVPRPRGRLDPKRKEKRLAARLARKKSRR